MCIDKIIHYALLCKKKKSDHFASLEKLKKYSKTQEYPTDTPKRAIPKLILKFIALVVKIATPVS